jgi:hypothetical protein
VDEASAEFSDQWKGELWRDMGFFSSTLALSHTQEQGQGGLGKIRELGINERCEARLGGVSKVEACQPQTPTLMRRNPGESR